MKELRPHTRRGKNPAYARLRRLRQCSQGFFLLLFLTLALSVNRDRTALPLNLFLRSDPLVGLMSWVASHGLELGLLLGGVVIGITLLLGRVFCGWVCPLGTALELCNVLAPEEWRKKKTSRLSLSLALLAFVLGLALLGSTLPLALDPLTIAQRTFTVALQPALEGFARVLGDFLYGFGSLRGAAEALDEFGRWAGLLTEWGPRRYHMALLITSLFLLIAGLNLLGPRFWCRSLCPLGGMLTLLSRVSLLRLKMEEETCTECGLCVGLCPIAPPEAKRIEHWAECWRCADCLALCPRGSLSLTWEVPSALRPLSFDPSRRALLTGFIGGLGAAALLRTGLLGQWRDPHALRPPGARIRITGNGVDESDFLSLCVRCGLCWKVCPTNGLQPAFLETGIEGFWTPLLKPRLGYCDYTCTACGEVCPTGAIERLSLEEKRRRVIGVAHVDKGRCLRCFTCQEVCPTEAIEVKEHKGKPFPRVIPQRCIGCGLCENSCPVPGEAAIRVYAPGALPRGRGRAESLTRC